MQAIAAPRGLGASVRLAVPRRSIRLACRVAAPSKPGHLVDHEDVPPPKFAGMSYDQQYDVLFKEHIESGTPLKLKQLVPKPDRDAQAKVPGAHKVAPFSDIYGKPRTNQWLHREWSTKDKIYGGFFLGMHLLAACAPFCFSWRNVGEFFAMYFVTGALGVTLSYHRGLTHKSYKVPKWLEYILAYCGAMSCQGSPLSWVSNHRYHHLHCDTPLDPHSPYEGFWWSHAGWLLDSESTYARDYDQGNAKDMASDPFYQHLDKYYVLHVLGQLAVIYLIGGFDSLVWAGALRICWVWHVTWFVNSASHVWGYQDYNTGDLSMNNWWVGILGFGEGWHNNHHAFESSARHGLEWWQLDVTWLLICGLRELGLATDIKLPTEKQKDRLRLRPKSA